MLRVLLIAVGILFTSPLPVLAQPQAPLEPVEQETVATSALVEIPAGTEITLELMEPLSSRTSQTGDTFALRLVEPIVVDGQIVVPAGSLGRGEVIDAAPSEMAGRPGKLVIGARVLTIRGRDVQIRGMTLFVAGENLTQDATRSVRTPCGTYPVQCSYDGPSLFDHGGEIDLPTGTRGRATINANVDVAPSSAALALNTGTTTAPATERAEIIFFRPDLSTGAAYAYHVVKVGDDGRATEDAERVASLRNRSYSIYEAEPGIYSFNVSGPMTVNRAQNRLRMEVEAGQRYYVVLDFRSGVFTAGFILLPSDLSRFNAEGFSSNGN